MDTYLTKLTLSYQGSKEEKDCAAVLFNETTIIMGDARLNNIAALTFNLATCQRIFGVIDKALNSLENPWKTLCKGLYLVHTIVLYGSEAAIDMSIKLCPIIYNLTTYNSALVKKSFFSSGGTDYGGPVREEAKVVYSILCNDKNIRSARSAARQGNNSWAIPMGELPTNSQATAPVNSNTNAYSFGQGALSETNALGAGFSLEQVPGMYEGRPERYFDKDDDMRRQKVITGDHQFTREKLAPSLLDLMFDDTTSSSSSSNQGNNNSNVLANTNFNLMPAVMNNYNTSSNNNYIPPVHGNNTNNNMAMNQSFNNPTNMNSPYQVNNMASVNTQIPQQQQQQQLEAQLAEQKAQLERLQAAHAALLQQQQMQQNMSYNTPANMGNMGQMGLNMGNMGQMGSNMGNMGQMSSNMGNMGQMGSNMGNMGSNMGNMGQMGSGNMGQMGSNMGNMGQMGSNMGNMGQMGSNMGQMGSNMGNMGQIGSNMGNMGQMGSNMGQMGSNMGNAYGNQYPGMNNMQQLPPPIPTQAPPAIPSNPPPMNNPQRSFF